MRIVWLLPDGSTQYQKPLAPRLTVNGREETDDEYVERMAAREAPSVRLPRNPDEDDAAYQSRMDAMPGRGYGQRVGVIPEAEYASKCADAREYREAWTWKTNAPVIDIDLDKARAIHLERLGNANDEAKARVRAAGSLADIKAVR